MPRKSRFIIPGEPQHVIIRGVNRHLIFVEDKDYIYYLNRLSEAMHKHNCDLHAYVLMDNHVHLLVTPHDADGLSKAIQMLGRYYVKYFNFNYRRTGTLWEGRFKSCLVDRESYLLACYKYIELNPVRSTLVEHPGNYPWSSFHYNALGKYDVLITPHEKYSSLGEDKKHRLETYRDYCTHELQPSYLKEIRSCLQNQWVLGSAQFKGDISIRLKRRTGPLPTGGDRKSCRYKQRHNQPIPTP